MVRKGWKVFLLIQNGPKDFQMLGFASFSSQVCKFCLFEFANRQLENLRKPLFENISAHF
jgi:hypothetical protein